MRSRQQLAEWAAAKLRSGQADWLSLPELGEEKVFSFPLQPPTEATALADPAQTAAWVTSWREAEASRCWQGAIGVCWTQRRWPSLGLQQLPVRVVVHGTSALAALAGNAVKWRTTRDRASLLRAEFGDGVNLALPTIASHLTALPDEDIGKTIVVLRWLLGHPDTGLFIRQLPIVGVDTKWLERHRGLVNPVMRALTGRDDLGLRRDPRRFRVRILDDAVNHPLRDFTASATELAALDLSARWVLICENLATVQALGTLPGVVAVHGLGLDVVELAEVGWIKRARQCYWGDLDSHGLRILGLARKTWPGLESIMMDVATLEHYEALIVPEPAPYRGEVRYLTMSEQAALHRLREGDCRLEQERIAWDDAWAQLRGRLAP